MQSPGTNIGSHGPLWGREEQTKSMKVPLIIGTGMSHNSGIPTSEGNPISSVWAGGNRNMFSTLAS